MTRSLYTAFTDELEKIARIQLSDKQKKAAKYGLAGAGVAGAGGTAATLAHMSKKKAEDSVSGDGLYGTIIPRPKKAPTADTGERPMSRAKPVDNGERPMSVAKPPRDIQHSDADFLVAAKKGLHKQPQTGSVKDHLKSSPELTYAGRHGVKDVASSAAEHKLSSGEHTLEHMINKAKGMHRPSASGASDHVSNLDFMELVRGAKNATGH